MDIVVIGTSNSILRGGYTAGLSADGGVNVRNFSLGSSTSVVLPKILSEPFVESCDFIVFDFCVNEEYWVRTGRCSLEEIQERLFHFLSETRHLNAVPVIAVLPTISGLSATLPVHQFYRNFAQRHGYPLFDGFRFAAALAAARETSAETLFMDPEHLHREVAFEYGRIMASALREIHEARPERGARSELAASYSYRTLTLSDSADARLVHRENSLTQGDFLQVGAGGSVNVSFENDVTLMGIGANIGESNDWVKIRGKSGERSIKLAGSNYKGTGSSLIYVVFPFSTLSGREFNLFSVKKEAENSVAEVAGFTVRGDDGRVEIPTFQIAEPYRDFDFQVVTMP